MTSAQKLLLNRIMSKWALLTEEERAFVIRLHVRRRGCALVLNITDNIELCRIAKKAGAE